MIALPCLMFLVTEAPTPLTTTVDESWLLAQVPQALAKLGDPWDGATDAALEGTRALTPDDPMWRELTPLFATLAQREPKGIAPRSIPCQKTCPWWKLASVDLDHDGQPEIVMTGGNGPAPYFAVLQRLNVSPKPNWRILYDAPFRYLGATTHDTGLYLFAGFDGYGVASPTIMIARIDAPNSDKPTPCRWQFNLLEALPNKLPTTVDAIPATTLRQTQLRTTPMVDDAPNDRGLGEVFPGNLFQTLTQASSGWCWSTPEADPERDWSLCLFVGNSPLGRPKPRAAMLKARKLVRMPLTCGSEFLVGWLRVSDWHTP